MAVGDNTSTMDIINEEEKNADNPHLSPKIPKKRTKDPGVRIIGGRIYDSENGKTCHQCRQKTLDFSASCKRVKDGKLCTLAFCHKCLLNRYGEKAEEVGKLEDWMCPRCRGVCNCSFCMKRKGYQPTGILSHTAKAIGFNSVEELLHKKGDNVLDLRNVANDSTASPKKSPLSSKGLTSLKRKCDKENQHVEKNVPESIEDGLAKKEKKGPKRLKNCNGSVETKFSVAGAETRPPKLSESNVSAKCGDNESNEDKEHVDIMKTKALLKVRKPKKVAVKSQSVELNVPESIEDGLAKKEKKGPKSLRNCSESVETKVSVAGAKATPPKLSEANASAKCGDNDSNQDKDHANIMKAKALLKVRKPKKVAVKSQSVELKVPESIEDGLAKKEKKGPKNLKNCNESVETQVSVAGTEATPPKLSEANVSAKCADNESNQDKEHADIMKAKSLLKVRKPKKLAVKSQSVELNVPEATEDWLTKKEKDPNGLEHCNGSIETQVSVAGAEATSPKLSEVNVSAKCGVNESNQDKEHTDSTKPKVLLKVCKPEKLAVKSQSVELIVPESIDAGLTKKEKKGPKRLKNCNGSEETQVSVADAEARSPKLSEPNVSAKCGDNETNQDKEHAYTKKVMALLKVRKPKKLAVKSHIESQKEDFVMPLGKPLKDIGGLELPSQDIGAALQFLEFCDAFSEVLDITKGQPECILRDITKGHTKRLRGSSALIRFNIKLLSLIDTEMKQDGDEWLQTLKNCIEDSYCTFEELPMEFLDKGSSGYHDLEPSKKLKLLTFLCDEVLDTDELRELIDKAEVKLDEGRKENREKVVTARKKEKLIKQKAKDEMAKFMLSAKDGTALSLAEFDGLLSQIRSEADQVQAEVCASLELLHKIDPELEAIREAEERRQLILSQMLSAQAREIQHQRFDAVRTDSLMLGSEGQILWKLSCYNRSSKIILQDIGNWGSIALQDKWFIFNEEEEALVEKYVSSLSNRTFNKHRFDDAKEEMKSDPSKVPGSKDCFSQGEDGSLNVDKADWQVEDEIN